MRRLTLKIVAALLLVGVLGGALGLGWWWFFMLPRVERYPDYVRQAARHGAAPVDHHYEVALDLVDALPQAQFSTPQLTAAVRELADRLDARLDRRANHVLARLATLGDPAYLMYARRAIHLPTPGVVTYRFTVPAGARLEGEIGMLEGQSAPIDFRIDVNGAPVWSETETSLRPFFWNQKHVFYVNFYQWLRANVIEERKSRWVPFRVDLSPYAGQEIALTFRTVSSAAQPGQAFIGAPVVLARRDGPPRLFVLYINDGCNIDHLGAYGAPDGLTPTIDAFARQGARIERLVSGGNWSRPGVTTLLTGRPAAQTFVPTAPSRDPLPAAVREQFETSGLETLPIAFRRAGFYTVAAINNIFVTPSVPFAVDLGFQELTQTMRPDISAFDVAHFVAETLAARRDENLLLVVHQNAPNPADPAPRRFRAQARAAWRARYANEPVRLEYLASLAFADHLFHQFLAMLEKLGLGERATIVFTADHGQLVSPAHDIKTPDKPDVLRRSLAFHGQTLYDEEVLVPCLLRGPGIVPGRVIAGQHQSLALLPTLLELAGLGAPGDLPAASLAPALRDAAVTAPPDRYAFTAGKYSLAMRADNRFKYVRWFNVRRVSYADPAHPRREAVREELFDLQADPRELRNLAASNAALLSQMRAAFAQYAPAQPLVWVLTVPEQTADAVRITGARRVVVASGGEARPVDGGYAIAPTGTLRAAIFRDPAQALRIDLSRQGAPWPATELRFGAAFVRPPPAGFALAAGEEPPDSFTRYLPPAPDGRARPHLCLMEWADWAALVPRTGDVDPAVKDMLKKWGYAQ